jgi:TP901 family phage tail tape measure protein
MAHAKLTILVGMQRRMADMNRTVRGFRSLVHGFATVTLPLVAITATAATIRGTITATHAFETSMLRVKALTGATGETFERLETQAAFLGETTQFSASQAADAMTFLAQAGLNAEQILGAMPDTLNLAAASQIQLAEAADITTNILAGYGLEVSDLARVNDVLVNAITTTNTSMIELGEAMKTVAPVASQLEIPIEETTAALGLLANAGIKGEAGGTALRNALVRLLDPSAEVTETIDRLGLHFTDAQGNVKGFSEIMAELERTGADAGEIVKIFGVRAGPAMLALLEQGSSALDTQTDRLREQGSAARIAEMQMSGLDGAWKKLKSALEGMFLAIGEKFLKAATATINAITEYYQLLGYMINEADMKFLTLLMEAAFQEGARAVKKATQAVFGGPDGLWSGVLEYALLHQALLAKSVVTITSLQVSVLTTFSRWLAQILHGLMADVGNSLLEKIEAALNATIDGINWMLPKALEMKNRSIDFEFKAQAKKWSELFEENRRIAEDINAILIGGINAGVTKGRDLLGAQKETVDDQVSAWERLRELMTEASERKAAFIAGTSEPSGKIRGGAFPVIGAGEASASPDEKKTAGLPELARGLEQTFTGSLSAGISGLITRTQDKTQALLALGRSVVSELVGGITEMGIEAIKNIALQAGQWLGLQMGFFSAGQSAKATDSARNAGTAATTTAALSPAAAAASITSFGAAAAIGLAALLVAVAAISGGFAEGGHVGPVQSRPEPQMRIAGDILGPNRIERLVEADRESLAPAPTLPPPPSIFDEPSNDGKVVIFEQPSKEAEREERRLDAMFDQQDEDIRNIRRVLGFA